MNAQNDSLKQLYRLSDSLKLPGIGFDAMNAAARALRLAAAVLERTAVNRCNGIERWDAKAKMRLASWTDEDEARAERSDAKQEARATEALRTVFGDRFAEVRVAFQGDPRGAMIVIYPASDEHGTSNGLARW